MTERLIGVAIERGGKVLALDGLRSHWDLRVAVKPDYPGLGTDFGGPDDIEGFISSEGRFYTRRAAVRVAIEANQIDPQWENASRALLSSDIDW